MFSFFCESNKTLEKVNGFRTAPRPYQGFTGCVFFVVLISIVYLVIICDLFPYKGAELRHGSDNGSAFKYRNVLIKSPDNSGNNRGVPELMPQGNFLRNDGPESITSNLPPILFLNFERLTFPEEVFDQNNNEGCKETGEITIDVKIHSFLLGLLTGLILYLLVAL
jgi:hypothetical protein